MQNKIHYAVHGETPAEVIYHRADAEKDFMGIMSFSGNQPTLKEAKIAKNYLDEKELKAMGQIVSGYLDFAERQAEREKAMTMEDWAKHLEILAHTESWQNDESIEKIVKVISYHDKIMNDNNSMAIKIGGTYYGKRVEK